MVFLRIMTTLDSLRCPIQVYGPLWTAQRCVIPSKPAQNMEKIHDTRGFALSATPYELD